MAFSVKRGDAQLVLDKDDGVSLSPGFGKAVTIGERGTLAYEESAYDQGSSFQPVGVDLNLDPNAGSFSTTSSKYLAPIMGNILLRDDLAAFSHTFTAVDAGDVFTVTAHGLATGDGPFEFVAGSGALPTGISAATPYWVIVLTADTFNVATSKANALAGTVNMISSTGTTHATRLMKIISSYMPGTGNYLAGVIGKYNVPSEVTSKYPCGGVVAEIGEEVGNPTVKPDAAVIAVIGGDSQRVNANAYFGVRCLNSNSGSGADYGVDLYDSKASGLSYVSGAPSVAAIRFPNAQLLVTLDTAITANSTTTSAPIGSIGITSHATGRGKLFMADGTKWQFAVVA